MQEDSKPNNKFPKIINFLRIVIIVILAGVFISLGVLMGIVVGYWKDLPPLDALEYKESEKWKFHLEVYSDLSTIEVGDTKEYLLDRLKRLKYVQVGRETPQKGEYSLADKSIRIYTNDFRYPRLSNKGHLILVKFKDNRIASIEKSDGTKLQSFHLEPELMSELYGTEGTARQLVRLPDIPQSLLQAFIVTEDRRFYRHWGIDIYRVAKATYKNLRARRIVEGSGTITMQLARYLFFTRKQTMQRKIKEALLALKIERRYSKDEILERYLNFIDLGRYASHQIYGVQQASLNYFGKPVWELSLHESALLAALPKSPSRYSPVRHPDRARQRRNLVLRIMLKRGYITLKQYESSVKMPLEVKKPPEKTTTNAPHFLEYIKIQLEQKYKSTMLYSKGLKVYTTLDTTLQTMANSAIASGLRNLDKELGFPNYDDNDPYAPNGIDPLKYIQGALVAIDPKTGYIKAMVGGRDFYISRNKLNYFNRAVQAERQPGSAFKPFVYCAAFSSPAVANPASTIDDEPWSIDIDRRRRWAPENYTKRYWGTVTLWTALTKSINVATARLMNEKVGIERTIDMAKRMGIKSELRPVPSIALGSSEVTLLELTSAYGVWADRGFLAEPISILYIVNQNGEIIEENVPRPRRVIDENAAYQMTSVLQGVLDDGTGKRARQAPLNFRLPAAGKTGTTNNYSDAWFIGYIPDLVAGVWVGFDDPQISVEHTGATGAMPIWAQFMKKAAYRTIKDFVPEPREIIFLEIDKSTGMLKNRNCPKADIVKMAFINGNHPTELCTEHP
ncbi:TPA: PBP1A family penicillin-binding protein [Candidatus Poribacteria bacterium]|nr:PBP1A family penicillin-binding protein [Candidatus Poribacteria bacterium]